MASTFSISNEVDKQSIAINSIGRAFAEFVAPQTNRLPGAQFTRRQADDIRQFAHPWDKLKVMQPDFRER